MLLWLQMLNCRLKKETKLQETRARKASLELEKVLKEFRKVSLEESKNK